MPLDPFRYSQPIVDVYAACVDELLINLARHFNVKGTGNSGSFSYQTRMLAKMGAIQRESAAIIARYVKENEPMIQLAVEQAMLEAIAQEEPQLLEAARQGLLHDANIPVQESIQKQLTAYSRQAMQQTNLVNTVMLEGTWKAYQDGVYQAANILKQMDVAQTALNTETGKVITGVSTRQQAVRSAVKKMAEVGITGFIDNGGHKWSPEAYVQMDIKTTCSNAARQAVFDRNRDYGNDLVWVRINATARPKCYPWQGKVISTEGRSGSTTDLDGREILFHSIHDTSYGEPDGLWGINCHHGPPNVFIPGLSSIHGSVPDPDDNAAAYALTQQQRKLERDVRAAKREAAMLDAAGDREGFEKAALRLKQRQQTLKDFTEENGLYLRGDRTQVVAYNRSVAGKAAAAADRAQIHTAYQRYFGTATSQETAAKYRSIEKAGDKWLLDGYVKAVDKGDISALVGIDHYLSVAHEADAQLVNLQTTKGITVQGYVTHFVDRLIGQTSHTHPGKREGVALADAKQAITHGTPGKTQTTQNGQTSILLVGDRCAVSINPATGILIQCNPKGK